MSAQKRRNDTVKFCVLNYTLYTLTLFGEGGGGGEFPVPPCMQCIMITFGTMLKRGYCTEMACL